MKIAVEGFMHGDLDKVYKTIKYIENTRNIEIDLLLCCGDFEAVRNERDMDSLNAPPKYREMKSFWKYYSDPARNYWKQACCSAARKTQTIILVFSSLAL
ncbi:hypothetical protein E1A91_A12G000200v1 [Gossypium mustelinum]|uniref:Calcineurin-like phosphoesterase domain-containing protein n=2 Tax=Gossypium TaxID=3633 RepID=A0A5D2WMP6_GOSMU|nr:hypothetical protein ES332_A12G000100v1 [Gossypium tomentosum]TYJ03037.1 hypothetical protein E1A91_A12G000200v1 [Gossypium mustelinum]TYJ03038.1 hypothetical protein E1A91_A12G000200v1 [Gossypium mustelinum]